MISPILNTDAHNDDDDADLSVDGHAEIPDESSGSTSRSAARCRQVQGTLVFVIIVIFLMVVMIMMTVMMMSNCPWYMVLPSAIQDYDNEEIGGDDVHLTAHLASQ